MSSILYSLNRVRKKKIQKLNLTGLRAPTSSLDGERCCARNPVGTELIFTHHGSESHFSVAVTSKNKLVLSLQL